MHSPKEKELTEGDPVVQAEPDYRALSHSPEEKELTQGDQLC